MYANNKLSWSLYGIGLFIVLGTHVYMLVAGIPPEQMTAHAILNLVAALLLATDWLSRKA